jgi:hypothetical protein
MPNLIVTDTFNRADTSAGTVGNGWSVLGSLHHIASNVLVGDAAGGNPVNATAYYPTSKRSVRLVVDTGLIKTDGTYTRKQYGWLRYDQVTKTGYLFRFWPAIRVVSVQQCSDGVSPANLSGAGGGDITVPNSSVDTAYRITFDVVDGPLAGQSTITVTVTTVADTTTILGTFTTTDSISLLQRAGYCALGHDMNDGLTQIADQASYYDLFSAVPDAGTIGVGTIDGVNHNVVSLTGASGGAVQPLSYSWYRSRALDFTPGPSTLIAGQTAVLSILAPDAEVWYYRRRASDSSGPPNTADTAPLRVARGGRPWSIVNIGDSIEEGSGTNWPGYTVNAILATLLGPRVVTCVKAAKAGAYLCNETGRDEYYVIQPGLNSNFYYEPVSGVVAIVAAAYNANPNLLIGIRLGINDTSGVISTAAKFGTSLDALLTDLKTRFPSAYFALHAPNYCHFTSDVTGAARTAALEGYIDVLRSRADELRVFVGETDSWSYYADHPSEQSDGVHPDSRVNLGYLEAAAYIRIIDRIEGRGTGTSTGARPNRVVFS